MIVNKILIIAGMHRSGTSLITQWLYRCGLNVGDKMLGPLTGNDEGHFEDLDFVDAHKDILRDQHLPDTGLFDQHIEMPDNAKRKLRNLVQLKNQQNDQWGWKDPRACLFLASYKELIPTANYLFIIRDYTSSVSSLINRIYKQAEIKYLKRSRFSAFLWKTIRKKLRKKRLYNKFSEAYLKVWIMYNEKILDIIRLLPESDYMITDYTLLNKKDELIFSHLTDNWNFSLNFVAFKNVYKGNLINTPYDIRPYVRNKALLSKAEKLENELRSYGFQLKQKSLTAEMTSET